MKIGIAWNLDKPPSRVKGHKYQLSVAIFQCWGCQCSHCLKVPGNNYYCGLLLLPAILISKLFFHVWLALIWTSTKNEWYAKHIAGARAFALISPTLPNLWLLHVLAYLWCCTFSLINNGNRTEWSPIIQCVIIRVIHKIRRPHSWSLICLIASMITDRIGWHEVLLPIDHNCNKICDILSLFWLKHKFPECSC